MANFLDSLDAIITKKLIKIHMENHIAKKSFRIQKKNKDRVLLSQSLVEKKKDHECQVFV